MNDTDYAYAVARIRANESSLLSAMDMEQLVSADDYDSVLRILEAKGWIAADRSEDVALALKRQMEIAWQLLCDISPDINALTFLIVKNDFHNIKAALKLFVTEQMHASDRKSTDSFILPASIDPGKISDAVRDKKLMELPDFAKDAIQKTYDVLIHTMDGQLGDIMLDEMALETIMTKAEETGNLFIKETAELLCVTANMKTAFRAARTGKDEHFLETALCRTSTLDKARLKEAAANGLESLIEYISATLYGEAAEHMKTSAASFEKWCDDVLISHVKKAKYLCLGVEPLIAYYVAKDMEIKSVRIILSCKHNGLPQETIRERMRKLYV